MLGVWRRPAGFFEILGLFRAPRGLQFQQVGRQAQYLVRRHGLHRNPHSLSILHYEVGRANVRNGGELQPHLDAPVLRDGCRQEAQYQSQGHCILPEYH